jgi:hypothetical protein
LFKKDAAVGWDWESHVCPGFLFSTAPSENSNLSVTPGIKAPATHTLAAASAIASIGSRI